MEESNAEQELRTILKKAKEVMKEDYLTGKDMRAIPKKMKDNGLFEDWARIRTMVVNYLKMEWPESQVPSWDELVDVCCSVINDPGNMNAFKLNQYLSVREREILIFTLCQTLKEQFENETEK